MTRERCFRLLHVLVVAAAIGAGGIATDGAVSVIGVQYQQDNPYAEYLCWYHYGNYPTSCGVAVAGSNVHVFLKNNGGSSVTISDVTLAGHSLKTILKRNANQHDSNSIYYYWQDPPPDIFDAGEPVWYRCDPNPIPAGGTARVIVRLRSVPVTRPVSIVVNTSAGNVAASVPVSSSDPVLANVGFSADRTKVYLTWRRGGGAAPTTIRMDDVDVTTYAVTVGDPAVNFATTILTFPAPLANMSYHVYQGVYSDGKTATGALRTWINRFLYGTWGAKEIPDNDFVAARAWIDSCNNRGVNCVVMNSTGGLQDYLATSEGRNYAEAHDYGYVKDSNVWGTNPRMWLIEDEPDIEEGNISCGTGYVVPCGGGHLPGIRGLHMLELGEALRSVNPSVPTTINLDGNFKPDGWYAYGQLADVMMVDSYYEQEMAGNHWYHPERDPLYTKPTSIYACAIATTTAAEPNPMHMILYSCEYKDTSLGYIWPFPSPASKRIQAYYALAGGAKGMAYWWYKSGYPYNGLNDGGPEATALWKEIGLIGDEIKTLQPQLVASHPVTMPLTPGNNVWARALVSGTDTIILLAVNDSIYMDTSGGCTYTPVSNATVTCTLPSWMQLPTLSAFEVSAGGINDISISPGGSQLQVNLGTLGVTKMIVLTTNPQLWTTVTQRYDQLIRPGVNAFAPELFAPLAPAIVQHPSDRVAVPGGTASFTVAATGSWPRTYQWQKNQTNLSDGGHYTGCTTPTLMIANCDSGDVAGYRCVVINSAGTATSNTATLTLGAPVGPTITQHPSNQAVNSGETATFAVAATGTTPLTYQWQKNQVNLSNGGHYSGANTATLTITGADSSDAASYRCVVANGYGSVTSNEAALTVTVCISPSLVNGGFEGANTAGIAAGWTGYTRVEVPSTVAYTIQTTSPAEGLQYQQIQTSYVASGGAGVYQVITGCTSGATYRIQGSFRTNSANGRATIRCAPDGSTSYGSAIDLIPAATTTSNNWVAFGGTVTATASSITLFLDCQTHVSGSAAKAAAFDGITVTCVASVVPPAITQHPAGKNVCPGWTATFNVAASGAAPLSYQWQKNQTNLSNGGHYSGVTTATLTVSSADTSDAAGYRCVVTNGGGSANSNAASLTLKTATAVTQHPQSQAIAAGGTALFTVTGTGDGVLSYQWQKNSVDLAEGGHYVGVTLPTLTVSTADSNDAADYRCMITAGCGSASSSQATLTVGPPTVPGDFDQDNDVDQEDFGHLQYCLGPSGAAPTDPDCADADLDKDPYGDVSQGDVTVFVQCMTGAGVAGNPDCSN